MDILPADHGTAKHPDPTVRRAVRVLLTVHELHRLGYQFLRIEPGMSPSGLYWRVAVAPARLFRPDHGALLAEGAHDHPHVVRYSSADDNRYFGWLDSQEDSAPDLAVTFVRRFPEIAAAGLGRDWAYAGWFTEMLGLAVRGAVPVAYAEFLDSPPGVLPTTAGRGFELPMPPPPLPLSADGAHPLPPPAGLPPHPVNDYDGYMAAFKIVE